MPQVSLLASPVAVQMAMDEFAELGRRAFLKRYAFEKSLKYMVINPRTGELCDSKAIAGVAFGKQFPELGPLTGTDFVGAESTVELLMQSLGFEVQRVAGHWTEQEVQEAIEDYFQMLRMESEGIGFNKSEHNANLRQKLNNRSKGSVELKHQNISAVLASLELPYINGYKPRSNAQLLLRQQVQMYVLSHAPWISKIVDSLEEVKTPAQISYLSVLVDAPSKIDSDPTNLQSIDRVRLPRKLDFVARDEANRRLGRAGEEWALGYEEYRLVTAGMETLVPGVDWVSESKGDGAGFDILSFEDHSQHRFIEVKTTNAGLMTSFVLSRNELERSREEGDQFYLYRVFNFSTNPQLYMLRGDLTQKLHLKPMDYRASFREIVS